MKEHWDFFKESDSSFGLFYPMHYVVAGFDTLAHARQAEQALLDAGFAQDEVTAADGSFVVNQLEAKSDSGWLEQIKEQIGRIIGTEASYIDEDIQLARRDGAFTFAYAPDHDRMMEVKAVLQRQHPIYARAYQRAAIVHLIQPAQASNIASV